MKLLVTDAAWSDMLDIARSVASEKPERAESFLDELFDACHTIADIPFGYPLIPGREVTEIRRKVYGNYLIFYRVRSRNIEILRLLHGAREYEKLMFPEE